MRQAEGNGVAVCHCQILKLMRLMYVRAHIHIIDWFYCTFRLSSNQPAQQCHAMPR